MCALGRVAYVAYNGRSFAKLFLFSWFSILTFFDVSREWTSKWWKNLVTWTGYRLVQHMNIQDYKVVACQRLFAGIWDWGQLRGGSRWGKKRRLCCAMQRQQQLQCPIHFWTHVTEQTMKCSVTVVARWLHWFLKFFFWSIHSLSLYWIEDKRSIDFPTMFRRCLCDNTILEVFGGTLAHLPRRCWATEGQDLVRVFSRAVPLPRAARTAQPWGGASVRSAATQHHQVARRCDMKLLHAVNLPVDAEFCALRWQDPPLGRWLHRFGSHPTGSELMGGTGIRPCCWLRAEDAATRDLEELDERFFVGILYAPNHHPWPSRNALLIFVTSEADLIPRFFKYQNYQQHVA